MKKSTPRLARASTVVGIGVTMCVFCGGKASTQTCSTPAILSASSQDIMLQARSATAFEGIKIVISSAADACAVLYAAMPAEVTELDLFLNRATGTGMFRIDPRWVLDPSTMGAWLAHRPARTSPGSALPDKLVIAQSGTVTLTRWESGRIAGQYDVTFSDGARATGSFDTTYCKTNNVCRSQ